MQEHKFIQELAFALRSLPEQQRNDILADYRSHIFEARERGKSDEEIAASLGDAKTLARTFVADFHLMRVQSPAAGQTFSTSVYHFIRACIVLLSIVAFNFFFMMWPILFVSFFLGLAWFMTFIGSIVSVTVGFALLFGGISSDIVLSLFAKLSLSALCFGLFGISLLISIGLAYVTRFFAIGLMKYLKLNLKVLQPDDHKI